MKHNVAVRHSVAFFANVGLNVLVGSTGVDVCNTCMLYFAVLCSTSMHLRNHAAECIGQQNFSTLRLVEASDSPSGTAVQPPCHRLKGVHMHLGPMMCTYTGRQSLCCVGAGGGGVVVQQVAQGLGLVWVRAKANALERSVSHF